MSTIEVVAFAGGSAKMGIYTRDHCPPHATFREQTGQWVVRIAFSFRDASIALMGIHPPKNRPNSGVINELAQAVVRNLSECRRLWWVYQQNNHPGGGAVLFNQSATRWRNHRQGQL